MLRMTYDLKQSNDKTKKKTKDFSGKITEHFHSRCMLHDEVYQLTVQTSKSESSNYMLL